jgi:carbamoyl-phosphate synthase large subunit
MWLRKYRVLLLKNSPTADARLTTQMKSVGEVMAIGCNFQESLQKAMRGLEVGSAGFESRLPQLAEGEEDAVDVVRRELTVTLAQNVCGTSPMRFVSA